MTGKASIVERLKAATCGSTANHSRTTPEKPAEVKDAAVVQDKSQPATERTPRPVGRPRRYATPEAMEAVIDRYLQRSRRPTMTGLARALGFTGRQALHNYKRYGEEFRHAVLVARLRMECHYEQLLLKPGYSTAAAIRALKRLGWRGN
jgi:hypothetical protein